ncbi:MAG: 50S ribosomal protein L24 [Sphingomonadaceae bacterium]|nr:50S ribosomal protein L24 [Sphingomonadaceae bacterium]
MAAKIKKGDKVVILAGKDKGRHGEVTKVFPKNDRVLVDGINVAAHHRKPTQANPQGGIERVEKPIHISNVAIEDPKTGKPSRVRIETAKDGTKTRVAARSGEAING